MAATENGIKTAMATPARKFSIRTATPADVPRLASIGAAALIDDAFYNVLYPRRREFYDDYLHSWELKLQKGILSDIVYLAVETDITDESTGRSKKEIVGWAAWERMGTSAEAERIRAEGQGVLKRLEHRLLTLTNTYVSPLIRFVLRTPDDRSADAAALAKLEASHPAFLAEMFSGIYTEHWHVLMLAVDPKWQRNGIGQMLVRWGLERAQKEGVCVGLEASDPGAPMYLKLGFEEIGRFHTPKEGLHFPALGWRPRGTEGNDAVVG
ncbi:uncharacterized protein H6S33_012019 [Morchella sextelata]|uniref:uncharacterized protein n=1 Tax=Morchella sextelata TaxID=1174677 RepID=UPI001D04D66A|nr:uncharacterized protein H6S33_012019 [Morchella sextelata]KAH0610492.1 hypothetical protein H6S33_012019 [Morchella sextelata]